MKEAEAGKLRTGPKDSFWDQVFENEMNELVEETRKRYDRYAVHPRGQSRADWYTAPHTN